MDKQILDHIKCCLDAAGVSTLARNMHGGPGNLFGRRRGR